MPSFEDASLYWPSLRPFKAGAWHGHVAFAHWLVANDKPNILVELGTQNGVSYFSFCNAVKRTGIKTKCFAVDTWRGDDNTGLYDESIYSSVIKFNAKHFSDFSELKRMLFEEARNDFEDGSIDILHIDGLHTYEAVSRDFQTWRRKLSERAIVLFHDTQIVAEGFGVKQFWLEVSNEYPSFNFSHSAGLGVLAVGKSVDTQILSFLEYGKNAGSSVSVGSGFEKLSNLAQIAGQKDQMNFDFGGVNIALGCRAEQSSFAFTRSPTAQGAVNGTRNGTFSFHTEKEISPWWKVDLGHYSEFDEIRIFNRLVADCAHRARQINILTSMDGDNWNVYYEHDGSMFGGVDGDPLTVRRPRVGARFVMLQLRDENYLHLDEVEIVQAVNY